MIETLGCSNRHCEAVFFPEGKNRICELCGCKGISTFIPETQEEADKMRKERCQK